MSDFDAELMKFVCSFRKLSLDEAFSVASGEHLKKFLDHESVIVSQSITGCPLFHPHPSLR
jgi:hypothetical protein